MRNKNIVTKNVIYGIAGLTLLILAISLGTQTPSSAQIPPKMNGNNNNKIHQINYLTPWK